MLERVKGFVERQSRHNTKGSVLCSRDDIVWEGIEWEGDVRIVLGFVLCGWALWKR